MCVGGMKQSRFVAHSMDMSLNKLQEMVKGREAKHAAVDGVAHPIKSVVSKESGTTEGLNNKFSVK